MRYEPSRAGCVPIVAPPAPATGREKDISFVSISPLDRLLNQATQRDEIIARVGCDNEEGKIQKRDYDFDFSTDHVNKVTCQNGKTINDDRSACQIGKDTLKCGPGKAYTVEIFNNANKADIKSLGFFKLTR